MEREETLISDNEGNHLLVALDFYDEDYKFAVLNIPSEFADIRDSRYKHRKRYP